MLIAQGQLEDVTVVSDDHVFDAPFGDSGSEGAERARSSW
jgi:hypothetical protein